MVAWGYLVRAAIDFGTSAREGESPAWLFLALACVGAAACLFVGLILGSRLLRRLGITAPPPPPATVDVPAAPTAEGLDGTSPPTYRGRRIAP